MGPMTDDGGLEMSSENCIFCKIVDGVVPATKLFENEQIIAFDDIHPQSPVHFLVIPKKHIPTMDDLTQEDTAAVGEMMLHAARIAREKGVADTGYRQVINCRDDGGQEVHHLHLHIMGGRSMGKMG